MRSRCPRQWRRKPASRSRASRPARSRARGSRWRRGGAAFGGVQGRLSAQQARGDEAVGLGVDVEVLDELLDRLRAHGALEVLAVAVDQEGLDLLGTASFLARDAGLPLRYVLRLARTKAQYDPQNLFQVNQIVQGGETNYVAATLTLYMSIYNLFSSLLQLLMALTGDRD